MLARIWSCCSGVRTVFFGQVLAQVLAAWPHVRVQLKGLKVQISRNLTLQLTQGLLQCAQAHSTPRAGNVRDEINFQGSSHGKKF